MELDTAAEATKICYAGPHKLGKMQRLVPEFCVESPNRYLTESFSFTRGDCCPSEAEKLSKDLVN